MRPVICSTTASAECCRAVRTPSTAAAYASGEVEPSHGERHRPISASTHEEPAGFFAMRPPHCRMGKVSCSDPATDSAVRRCRNGPR